MDFDLAGWWATVCSWFWTYVAWMDAQPFQVQAILGGLHGSLLGIVLIMAMSRRWWKKQAASLRQEREATDALMRWHSETPRQAGTADAAGDYRTVLNLAIGWRDIAQRAMEAQERTSADAMGKIEALAKQEIDKERAADQMAEVLPLVEKQAKEAVLTDRMRIISLAYETIGDNDEVASLAQALAKLPLPGSGN